MNITFTTTHATLAKADYEKVRGFCLTHGLTDLLAFPEPAPEIFIPEKGKKFQPKEPDDKLLS